MNIRHGVIQDCQWLSTRDDSLSQQISNMLTETIATRKLHEISDWEEVLDPMPFGFDIGGLSSFLAQKLPHIGDDIA